MATYDSFLATDRERLARELDWTQKQLKAALAQLETLQAERARAIQETDTARQERDRALEELEKIKGRLDDASAEAAGLRRALHLTPPSETETALAAELPVEFTPSAEPIFEPGWMKVFDALRKALSSCYMQLRRLSSSPLQEGQRAALRIAASAVTHSQELVGIIATYSDEETQTLQGNLGALLSASLATWEPTLRKRKIRLSKKFESDVVYIRYAPEPFRVALYQLLRNVYEALPRGGSLVVRMFREESSGQAVALFEDTGPGFSPEAIENAFIPFCSTRPGHLGLGLAVVQRIMERLGGAVAISNSTQGGGVITLRFQLEETPSAMPEPQPPAPPSPPSP